MNIDIEEMQVLRRELQKIENKLIYNKMNPSQYYKKFVSYYKRGDDDKTYAFIVNVLEDQFEVRYIFPNPPMVLGILENTFVKFDDIFKLSIVEQAEVEQEVLKIVELLKTN